MLRKQSGRPTERFNKWGDARHSFRALMILGDLATNFIREKHPLFANAVSTRGGRQILASNSSTDLLNDSEGPRIISKRGRPKKSSYHLSEYSEPRYSSSRRVDNDDGEANEEGGRKRRNVGVPRHFENMVMMDHKKRKHEHREKEVEEEDSDAPAADGYNQDGSKRKRGRPTKPNSDGRTEPAVQHRETKSHRAAAEAATAPAAPTKKMGFPEFCEQLRDFFRVIGAWYGVSGPVILHYLREQILPVLRMLSIRQLPKDTITDLFLQISRTLSYKDITASFLNLMTIGRGFPFYAAIIHTLKLYDPDNLYGMKSMHYFVEPPPIQVITIYLRKVVEALDPATGKETFRQIATLMDEVVCEWKDYSIPLEQRLQKIVEIDRLLPEHCRGLRARLYHVLMLPTTVLSRVLQQQQELDEAHVLRNSANMVGEENAKLLRLVGIEALKETGIVPSGIPNTVLFNNVAYIKPVTSHPALSTLSALGVSSHIEQPIPVVNRVYSHYPSSEHVLQREAEARSANTGRVQFAAGTTGGSDVNFANVAPYQHYPPLPGPQHQLPHHQQQQVHGETDSKHVYANGAHALANGLGFSSNFPPSSYSFNPLYMDQSMGPPPPELYGYDGSVNPYMHNPENFSAYPPQQHQQQHMMPLPMPPHMMNMNFNLSPQQQQQQQQQGPHMPMPPLPPPPFSVSSALPPAGAGGAAVPPGHSNGHDLNSGAPMAVPDSSSAAATNRAAAPSPADESTIAFLKNAHSKVPEQFKVPFLGATKDLVKALKDPNTPDEEIEARVLVVSSFIPQAEEALKDEIKQTFTVENFKPYRVAAAAASSNSSGPRAGAVDGAEVPFPSYFQQYRYSQQLQQLQQRQHQYHQPVPLSAPQQQYSEQLTAANRAFYNSLQLTGRPLPPPGPTLEMDAATATSIGMLYSSNPRSAVPPPSPPQSLRTHNTHSAPAFQMPASYYQLPPAPVQQQRPAQQNASNKKLLHPAAAYVGTPPVVGEVNVNSGQQLLLPSIKQMESTRTSDMVTSVATSEDAPSSTAASMVPSPPPVPSIPPLLLSRYPVLSSVSNVGVVHDGTGTGSGTGSQHSSDALTLLEATSHQPKQSTAAQGRNEAFAGSTPQTSSTGFVDWGSVAPLVGSMGTSTSTSTTMASSSSLSQRQQQQQKHQQQELSTAEKITAMRSSLANKLPRAIPMGAPRYHSGIHNARAAAAAAAAQASTTAAVAKNTPSATTSSSSSRGAHTHPASSKPSVHPPVSASVVAPVVVTSAPAPSPVHAPAPQLSSVPAAAFEPAPTSAPFPSIAQSVGFSAIQPGLLFPPIAPFPYPAGHAPNKQHAAYLAPERQQQQQQQQQHQQQSSGSSSSAAAAKSSSGESRGGAGDNNDSEEEEDEEENEEEEEMQPANTANFATNKRKATLAAGPQVYGEDKQIQLQKAMAFYFELEGTNHELSLTLLSEKFRINHAKLKTALQTEIARRIRGWNEKLCDKLEEVLALHKARSRKDCNYTLAMAAEASKVPYMHALLWYIKHKASVNRFRTKPGDFKVKLHDMFVAYFKSMLEKNSSESRASISRRFQMTPALFSRKITELTDEQREYYQSLATAELSNPKHPLELADISTTASSTSTTGATFPTYMDDVPIMGSFSKPIVSKPIPSKPPKPASSKPATQKASRLSAAAMVIKAPSAPRIEAVATDADDSGASSVQAYRAFLRGACDLPGPAVEYVTGAASRTVLASSASSAPAVESTPQPQSQPVLPSISLVQLPGLSSSSSAQQTPDAMNALLSGPPVLQAPASSASVESNQLLQPVSATPTALQQYPYQQQQQPSGMVSHPALVTVPSTGSVESASSAGSAGGQPLGPPSRSSLTKARPKKHYSMVVTPANIPIPYLGTTKSANGAPVAPAPTVPAPSKSAVQPSAPIFSTAAVVTAGDENAPAPTPLPLPPAAASAPTPVPTTVPTPVPTTVPLSGLLPLTFGAAAAADASFVETSLSGKKRGRPHKIKIVEEVAS